MNTTKTIMINRKCKSNIVFFESREQKKNFDLHMKLESYANIFLQAITKTESRMDIKCDLYGWFYQNYLGYFDKTGLLPYKKVLDIFDHINHEDCYYTEQAIRETLDNLFQEKLIAFYDNEKNKFYLTVEKDIILMYLANIERIKLNKEPILFKVR